MFEFLNPFRGLIETDVSPHARALRTDFSGKLLDAWTLFLGDWWSRDPRHVGLFDFLMLGIPAALYFLTEKAISSEGLLLQILGVLGLILSFPFFLLRVVTAAVCVFNPLTLIIIGIVELVSQYVAGGAKLKKQVLEGLENMTEAEVREESLSVDKKASLEKQLCEEAKSLSKDSSKDFKLLQKLLTLAKGDEETVLVEDDKISLRMLRDIVVEDNESRLSYPFKAVTCKTFLPLFKKNGSLNQDKMLRAMLKLNFVGLTKTLENQSSSGDVSKEALSKEVLSLLTPNPIF